MQRCNSGGAACKGAKVGEAMTRRRDKGAADRGRSALPARRSREGEAAGTPVPTCQLTSVSPAKPPLPLSPITHLLAEGRMVANKEP